MAASMPSVPLVPPEEYEEPWASRKREEMRAHRVRTALPDTDGDIS